MAGLKIYSIIYSMHQKEEDILLQSLLSSQRCIHLEQLPQISLNGPSPQEFAKTLLPAAIKLWLYSARRHAGVSLMASPEEEARFAALVDYKWGKELSEKASSISYSKLLIQFQLPECCEWTWSTSLRRFFISLSLVLLVLYRRNVFVLLWF